MKKLLPFLLLLLFSTAAQSQNRNPNQLLRQRVEQAKLRQIQQNLKMDEATFVRFRPIYLQYERSIANIDFKSQNRLMNVNADSLSAQEAENLILEQWVRAKKLINIRERFYMEFRKILTAQQLVKFYQTETQIRKKVMTELVKRKKANF